ncbi:methyl-accepting chemotaxis protein [Yoonia sp. SS1-5]|uniref:Methyl-accepting chemotaxis protein n=1 Tax=Yoonia rhodophyticola TaxID=3137370 RepID=A0AAN0MEB1_9RHOB
MPDQNSLVGGKPSMGSESHAISPEPETPRDNAALCSLISGLGYEIVDISGFLDAVHQTSDEQLATLNRAQTELAALAESSDCVVKSANRVNEASHKALDAVEKSVETVRVSAEKSQTVSGWVAEFDTRIVGAEQTLRDVTSANAKITNIAVQVNILAINAGIEAARAGDAGRGFAVVASAIKELSDNTSKAAKGIAEQVGRLSATVQTLKAEAQGIAKDATHILEQSSVTDSALGEIAQTIKQTTSDVETMAQQAANVDKASTAFAPAFNQMSQLARQTADGVTQANARSNALIERSEAIVQQAASLTGKSEDSRYIYYVQDAADRIREAWESQLAAGRITMADLFDRNYEPIPGSDPEQVMTRFTNFADATLPPILEAALGFDPKVVFCAAVDTSGYLPTHNKKFSHPQSHDPVWNAANCRNRRIFDDRVGLKAGRNTQPFLLQVYRRDMGGGNFTMMKDLSSPIMINGRHWGGLRMAYTFN